MSPHAAGARALYELGVRDGAPGPLLAALAGIGLAAAAIEGAKWLRAWQAQRQAQASQARLATAVDPQPVRQIFGDLWQMSDGTSQWLREPNLL